MKYFLFPVLLSFVLLASVPARAASGSAHNWTGCYLGANAGISSSQNRWQDPTPDGDIDGSGTTNQTAKTDMSGGDYGAQLGCDYQFSSNNVVVGIEGSFDGSLMSGTNQDEFNSPWTLQADTRALGALTGRLGWSLDSAPVLFYARGGIAFAKNKFEITNGGIFDGNPSTTLIGWTLAPGIEWAFTPHWSVFTEGDYYSFGRKTVSFPGDAVNPTPAFQVRTSQDIEALKVGVNYHF